MTNCFLTTINRLAPWISPARSDIPSSMSSEKKRRLQGARGEGDITPYLCLHPTFYRLLRSYLESKTSFVDLCHFIGHELGMFV